MKKQLAKHIINLVAHGHWVAVKEKDGGLVVFVYLRPDGELRGAYGDETVEGCLSGGLWDCSYSEEELIKYFTNEYQIITKPPKPYKKGDLVDILPIAKELPDFQGWNEVAQEMVGQKGLEIETYLPTGSYRVYTKEKSESWLFPHWCLAPHFQEETTEDNSDDKMEEAMKMLRDKGYKIIKQNNE